MWSVELQLTEAYSKVVSIINGVFISSEDELDKLPKTPPKESNSGSQRRKRMQQRPGQARIDLPNDQSDEDDWHNILFCCPNENTAKILER